MNNPQTWPNFGSLANLQRSHVNCERSIFARQPARLLRQAETCERYARDCAKFGNMPLESYEDYERFNAHLWEIELILTTFALRHGYKFTPPLEGGLYPCVSLDQLGVVNRSIHIAMEYEEKRYEHFFPEIPYSMSGAAWIDDRDQLTRWRYPHIGARRIPFCVLVPALPHLLDQFHNYLSEITEERIRNCAWGWPLPPEATDVPPQ